VKLHEKGSATVTTRSLRTLFFSVLAEVKPEVLRELDGLRRSVRREGMDPTRASSLAYRVLGARPDYADFEAPAYLNRWAAKHHIAWDWVLGEAATWLYDAKRGDAPRLENGLPKLTGGTYSWTENEPFVPDLAGGQSDMPVWTGSPIHVPPEPLVVQATWNFWSEAWTDFRSRTIVRFTKELDAYRRRVLAQAERDDYTAVRDKGSTSKHHMRWFVQWQVCDMSPGDIAEDHDSRKEDANTEPASVLREVKKLAERLGV
jgi:hypothetical protein